MSNVTTGATTSGTGIDGIFSFYDLNASTLIQRQSLEAMWGMTRDTDALIATISMLGNAGKFGGKGSIKTKAPLWGVGDYITERDTITADLKIEQTHTTGALAMDGTLVLKLAGAGYLVDDMIMVVDPAATVDTAGTGTTEYAWAVLRLTSAGATPTVKVEAVSALLWATTTSGSITFELETTDVIRTAAAVDYDRQARTFINVKPDMIGNFMQHTSDTVGSGSWERAETFLADHSLSHLVRLANKGFMARLNNALYVNKKAVMAGSGVKDYGISGGFSYFFNPEGLTAATVPTTQSATEKYVASFDYEGQNLALATLTSAGVATWVADLASYGSKTKLFFTSNLMAFKLIDVVIGLSSVQVSNRMISNLKNSIYPDMWQAMTIDFGYGSLQVITDNGIKGISQKVVTNTGQNSLTHDSLYWGIAVDPAQVKIIYLETENGVQAPKIVDVEKYRNDTVDEVEMDAGWMLAYGDPRTGGYLLTNA